MRPGPEDGRNLLALAGPVLAARAPLPARLLVLGVTPQVVQQPWPAHVSLLALDQSAEIIASVWQPHPDRASQVRQAAWEDTGLPAASVDLVAGDGSLNALGSATQWRQVLGELARVLKPGGALVLRCYVRPDRTETLPEVADAALGGRIGSFHVLKWRLAMAQAGTDGGIAVADILSAFDRLFPDRGKLQRRTGWPAESIATIDAYAAMATRYTFPTLQQLAERAAPAFRMTALRHGSYELAERCPTVLLEGQAASAPKP
ncbi:methyltransferase domain-containing protein [Azohydromonas aeria]|uniref:methyltransferase domain-containing protein n=1 Tax=Azohydromonas aeria TaxID=2590212 RepID=UPI0012F7849D|nr:methyltransferase domain-containing protein [Azohydromonas aeria]